MASEEERDVRLFTMMLDEKDDEIARLAAALAAREREVAGLREVLTACEWGDLTSDGWGKMIERCPICDHRKEHGHGKDCVLAAALAAPAQPPATGEGA